MEWKITKAGERRNVKDDEYYVDEKKVIWGKGNILCDLYRKIPGTMLMGKNGWCTQSF